MTQTLQGRPETGVGSNSPELPAPRYRRLLGLNRESWVSWVVFVVTVVLVLAPTVPTLIQSLLSAPIYASGRSFTFANFGHLFTGSTHFGRVIWNTARFAVLTTVLAMVLSVALAIMLVRIKLPGGRVMGALLLWPIYLSPLVLAFGFIIMYGPAGFFTLSVQKVLGLDRAPWNLYSIRGMALTEAVAAVPLGFLYCSNALKQADPSLENAARTCGAGPLRILVTVVLPMLRPPIFYASLLIFSGALESLSIPLLYGRPVGIEMFASFIFDNGLGNANPDFGLTGAAAMFTLVVIIALVSVQGIALRNSSRFVSVRGKASRPRRLDVGRWRWLGALIVLVYLILGPLLPILGLIARSVTRVLTPLVSPFKLITGSNYSLVTSYPAYVASIRNSVLIAVIGAVVVTLFASVVVVVARRTSFRFGRVLEATSLAPQAIPGLILGIGFFWAFATIPGLHWLNGTLAALIIAYGVRSLPAAFGGIAPIVMQIGHELDDAARSLGADWWRTFSRILFKLVLPGMLAAFTLLFVQMIKEFTPAVFLGDAGSQVIGTTALQLWLNGNTGAVAALSCVQIAITAVFVLLAGKVFKVRSYDA